MKYILLLVLLATAVNTRAQVAAPDSSNTMVVEGKPPAKDVKKFVEVMLGQDEAMPDIPGFKGGNEALANYLARNLKQPAKAGNTPDTVVLEFMVKRNGKIDDVKVVKGGNCPCAAEAIRVVKAMPPWNPCHSKGKKIPVYFRLPIIFQYSNENSNGKN